MADIAFRFGKVKFVDTGTALSIYYNDVLVGSIDSAGNLACPVADSIGAFDGLTVNASVGVAEKAYIEGDIYVSGYIKANNFKLLNTGGNAICGEGTLAGVTGKVTINSGRPVAGSIILLTPSQAITGSLYVDNVVDNTSFDVTSTAGGTDAGVKFKWLVLNLQ